MYFMPKKENGILKDEYIKDAVTSLLRYHFEFFANNSGCIVFMNIEIYISMFMIIYYQRGCVYSGGV